MSTVHRLAKAKMALEYKLGYEHLQKLEELIRAVVANELDKQRYLKEDNS